MGIAFRGGDVDNKVFQVSSQYKPKVSDSIQDIDFALLLQSYWSFNEYMKF
jgi:hypothetical protein